VAHHAGFDIGMINSALKRLGLPKLKNTPLDTGVLYKKTLLKSYLVQPKEHYSLDELAEKFLISKKDRHTALGDAYITALAFLKILVKIKEKKELSLRNLK
jgi:DNA polymerase-3 subunit epsilon